MDARAAACLLLGGLMAIAAALDGCAPTVSFEGDVVRTPGGVQFRVGSVPSGWQRVKVDDGGVAFHDDRGASVMVDGRCDMRSDDVPLVALTNQLLIGTTERTYDKEEVLPFDRREARHTVLHAKLDGVPLVWDVYVMKKDGCVYDIAYVAPQADFEHGRDAFERFASAFHAMGASP